ncbi:MAG: DUF4097 domain-containing protein [Oscillospiraceae bacterium]|nr:DUF4097 domain-containing protein [Oscillospiraceae bacterium]
MKALAIIFTCLFFASVCGFAITIAATGFDMQEAWDNWDAEWDNMPYFGFRIPGKIYTSELNKSFSESYSNIDIGIIAAQTEIKISPDNITRVDYTNNVPNVEFTAEIRNNSLVLKERQIGWGGVNASGNRKGTLIVEIPEKLYNKISLKAVSGKISGTVLGTKSLTVSITSGSVNLQCANVEDYDFNAVSGDINISGLSGHGKVNLTSGKVNLYFSQWNGSLDASLVSGNVTVTVPDGSGADLSFSRVSGSLSYSMNGDSGVMNKSGFASVGGYNRQRVSVDLISGSADIKTR